MSRKFWIVGAILLAATVLFFWSLVLVYRIPERALEFEPALNVRAPDGRTFVSTVSWFTTCEKNPDYVSGIYRMELRLRAPEDAVREGVWYDLVFPYVGGNAIRASLDGRLLGVQGDFDRGRSNIWNSVKVFPIPPGTLRRDSSVEVEIHSVYEAGFIKKPYIVEHRPQAARLWLLGCISESGIFALFGGILVLGLIVASIGLASLPRMNAKILLGAAAVCTALFLSDFMTLQNLPLPLLAFKRLNVILRHAAAALFIAGYIRLLGRRMDAFARAFVAFQGACVLVLFLPSAVVELKNTYTYTYFSVLPLPFYLAWLVLTHPGRRVGKANLLILYGVGVAILFALYDILSPFFWPDSILVSHFGFTVFTLSTLAYLVTDILQNYRQLVLEKTRAEIYREASMHDPLTQVFNRSVLSLVRSEISGSFAAVALDLDDFKAINDEYGHYAGDLVLLNAASILNAVFRRNDYVIRTGGDEFLAILPDCPRERAENIVRNLEERMSLARVVVSGAPGGEAEERALVPEGTVITYSASIGFAYHPGAAPTEKQFQGIINEADYQLYSRKRRRSG